MFDTIKSIWLGFSGQLSDTKEARKLVWLLLITFLAGFMATAFAAWISFPSYRSLVEFLPGAKFIAWSFTAGVAGFIYFVLAYISGFSVERWKRVNSPDYTVLGARIFGACAVVFLCVDVYMNMQGTGERAEQAVGERISIATYQTPPELSERMQADRGKLDKLLSGNLGGYGWKAKDGIYHLNNSGKKLQRQLSASLRRSEQADSTGRASFIADGQAVNQSREARQAKIENTLKNGVYGVYVLVLLLCVVQAYSVETIQKAEQAEPAPGAPVKRPKVARVQAPANNQISQQAATTAPVAINGGWLKVEGGWQITCSHCGQEAIKKHHLAKYCSDECRVEAWENRTGAKVKKGKGKKPRKIGF